MAVQPKIAPLTGSRPPGFSLHPSRTTNRTHTQQPGLNGRLLRANQNERMPANTEF